MGNSQRNTETRSPRLLNSRSRYETVKRRSVDVPLSVKCEPSSFSHLVQQFLGREKLGTIGSPSLFCPFLLSALSSR